ncbi:hypothetical protein C8R46DRAFT_1041134 [Mycena filopes]|nr:hypothetical protein C8R46DRAFT_1041134 [Mycena filopes]
MELAGSRTPGFQMAKTQIWASQIFPVLVMPMQSRSAVEDLISLLTDITMRGTERPGKVKWTRPFLLPLEPLPNEAALHIFEEITDNSHPSDEKTQLLQFTGNIPLALDLMAHLVEYEGLSNVLARWETEKTSVLSVGYDRSSNMDTSIALSLSSPRITPHSQELLSLLSILPDGLSDVELIQSNLPIKDILSCKSVLIATSLAYKDNNGRLRSLVPIREHVQQFFPPPEALVQALRKLFHDLLALYSKSRDSCLSSVFSQITANLANLDEILQWGLQRESLDLAETIESTTSLDSFYRITRAASTYLLNKIPLDLCGPRQRVLHIIGCLRNFPSQIQTQQLVAEGISQFEHFQEPVLEAKLYRTAARSSAISGLWIQELQFREKALALSKSTEHDPAIQCYCLSEIAGSKWMRASSASVGDYLHAMTEIYEGKELLVFCGMTSSELYYSFLAFEAEIHLHKSEYAEARRLYATNLQNSGLDPSSYPYTVTLLNIAQVDILIGTRKELVHQDLQTVYKISSSSHYLRGIIWCDLLLGHLELREGNPTSARVLIQDRLKANLGMDNEAILYGLEQLADVTQWPTEFHGQSKWPVVYLCQAHKTQSRLGLSNALLFTADIFKDDEATAQSLLTVALEEFTFMDIHRCRAQCMMRLGDFAQKQGRATEAAELWKSARPLFERSLQAKDVACIDGRLGALEQQSITKLTTLHAPITLLMDNLSEQNSNVQEEDDESRETDRAKTVPI